MKPSRIDTVLKELLATNWPAFIWGPPGVGKSSVVRSVASALELPVVDIRASLLDPTDLRGLPVAEAGRAVWYPPSFLPKEDEAAGLLFFDELNAAPPLVQASLYQLTLDRRVGEYRLPDGWRIVAAGNRSQDASVVFRMPAALANRFIHIDFEADYDDWRAWAIEAGIHPLVTGFLGVRRELLLDHRPGERAFPTPRSWEMLSDAIARFGKPCEAQDLLVGIVGEGAALEFLGYCDRALSEAKIRAIVKAPSKAALPKDLSGVYALTSHLASRGTEREIRAAAAALLSRLDVEFAVLLARDMLRASAAFAREAGFLAFADRHRQLLK
jgi:hypothetical protein